MELRVKCVSAPQAERKTGKMPFCWQTRWRAAMGIPEGVVPEGWWIGFKVTDDEVWEKVKDGTYPMFSIEGEAIREEVDEEPEN